MNFRQYKKIRKELIFYKKLLQERYNKEYYYCDNTSVIILLSKKEVKRITSLQNVFLKKNPYKKFNRIEKYEKEKAKRIIEHQERNKKFYSCASCKHINKRYQINDICDSCFTYDKWELAE